MMRLNALTLVYIGQGIGGGIHQKIRSGSVRRWKRSELS